MEIFDSAGEEKNVNNRYRIETNSRTGCFLLLFDLTRLETLDYLEPEIKLILHDKDVEECPMVLVGTKCDLIEEKDINHQEIERFLNKYKFPFIKVSSKESINVNEAFVVAIEETKHKKEKKEDRESRNSKCQLM